MAKSKVFNNAKWIIACKIAQSLLQFVIGMIAARYLGPSNYGLINYAASVVAFATPIMRLGLNSTLVQEFIKAPEKEGEIIGTSLVMNLVSAFACMVSVGLFVGVANPGELDTLLVCVLYSLTLVFGGIEMIQYWFQYKLLSKYSSLSMLVAYVVVSLYKIFLLITEKSVYWFVLSHSIEFGIVGISLIVIYFRISKSRLSVSLKTAADMFKRSKYYIISGLMVTVFANTASVLLKAIKNETETGYFSAAMTASAVANFIVLAIVDSMRPGILAKKENDFEGFKHGISELHCIVFYFAVAQTAGFAIFAPIVMNLLYGYEYQAAIPVLQILAFYIPFSYIGVSRDVWILAEQKQKYLWVINLIGAATSVCFNLVLIPNFGACGAAAATVITQFVTNFVLGFVIRPVRENNTLLLKGIRPKFCVCVIRRMINLANGK